MSIDILAIIVLNFTFDCFVTIEPATVSIEFITVRTEPLSCILLQESANQLEDRYGTDAHEVQQEAMEARLQRGRDSIATDALNKKSVSKSEISFLIT